MRQYLRQGYYPSGAPIPANSIPTPPASLVKAILIASAQPLTGSTNFGAQQQQASL